MGWLGFLSSDSIKSIPNHEIIIDVAKMGPKAVLNYYLRVGEFVGFVMIFIYFLTKLIWKIANTLILKYLCAQYWIVVLDWYSEA